MQEIMFSSYDVPLVVCRRIRSRHCRCCCFLCQWRRTDRGGLAEVSDGDGGGDGGGGDDKGDGGGDALTTAAAAVCVPTAASVVSVLVEAD